MAAIILVYIVILIAVALYLLTLAPLALGNPQWAAGLVTLLNGVCVGALWILKTRGRYELCANIVCGAVLIAIAAGILVSGGPLQSPAMPVLLVSIILGFVLCGKRM